jgi:hypothetical protein
VRDRPLIPRYKRAGHSVVVAAPRGEDPERARWNGQALTRLRDAYGGVLTGTVPGLGFPFQEGVFLKLDHVGGRWWCGFEPYTFADIPKSKLRPEGILDKPDAADLDPMVTRPDRGGDPAGDWRRERWAQRYNKNWAAIINAWAQLLTATRGVTMRAFGLEDGSGIDAVFEVSPVTGWSRPSHHHVYFDRSR